MFKAEYTKNKLKELGMKQVWMADKLGISSQYLSNIVNGTTKPPMKLAEDMAKIMGVDYRTLWTEYDDVQVTHSEWKEPIIDVKTAKEIINNMPIIVSEPEETFEEVPTVSTKGDGIWLDKDEATVLLEWFNRGHLFEIIRNDPSVTSMDWLSTMMCIYAKCKAVA